MDIAARSQLAAALVRVGAGDRVALRLVYRDTSAKLFGVLIRILNDRSEAEDALQDVFITIWKKADTFDPGRASPITWLVAIARNRAIDRLRSGAFSRRMAPIEEAENVRDGSDDALDMVLQSEGRARLGVCLDQLEERTARAIRSAFLEGSTYEELAEQMTVPLGTMKSWIRRGLLKLRACLES